MYTIRYSEVPAGTCITKAMNRPQTRRSEGGRQALVNTCGEIHPCGPPAEEYPSAEGYSSAAGPWGGGTIWGGGGPLWVVRESWWLKWRPLWLVPWPNIRFFFMWFLTVSIFRDLHSHRSQNQTYTPTMMAVPTDKYSPLLLLLHVISHSLNFSWLTLTQVAIKRLNWSWFNADVFSCALLHFTFRVKFIFPVLVIITRVIKWIRIDFKKRTPQPLLSAQTRFHLMFSSDSDQD